MISQYYCTLFRSVPTKEKRTSMFMLDAVRIMILWVNSVSLARPAEFIIEQYGKKCRPHSCTRFIYVSSITSMFHDYSRPKFDKYNWRSNIHYHYTYQRWGLLWWKVDRVWMIRMLFIRNAIYSVKSKACSPPF